MTPGDRTGRGVFITFEGGEGSGKSTQIARLAERLQASGTAVTATREPGGSVGADALRDILLSGAAEPLGVDMEAILFAAARIDHLENLILPALRRGDMVLCDRFLDSTRVYQGGSLRNDPEFLATLEEAALGELRPDLTLVLDLPAEEGLARAARRRGASEADRYERQDIPTHEARRQAFLNIARAEPDRCRVVDARRSVDEIADTIWDLVSKAFPLLGAGSAPKPAPVEVKAR